MVLLGRAMCIHTLYSTLSMIRGAVVQPPQRSPLPHTRFRVEAVVNKSLKEEDEKRAKLSCPCTIISSLYESCPLAGQADSVNP